MMRSARIQAIWRTVFTGAARKRVHFIINSQAVNPDVSKQLLACPGFSSMDRTQTHIAIAPYFGTYNPNTMKNLDVFLNSTLPAQINSLQSQVLGHAKFAKLKNMSLVTYESGIGLQGSGTASDLAILANRDPRMAQLYLQYFNLLRNSGVKLMMQFSSAGTFSTSACWGLLEATDQNPQSSPKYLGLQLYTAAHATCSASSRSSQALYSGVTCPQSCSFSGACVALPGSQKGRCECYYGSSGSYCQNSTYTEHTDLCGYYCGFNQGKCVPSYVRGNDRYWACECNAPYYGPQCQLFDCAQSCNYNGMCIDANTCSCYPGFRGTFCNVDCGCAGHGSCITGSVSNGNQTCLCDIGYSWSTAARKCVPDVSAPSCAGCQFGSCLDGNCECWAGYTGSSCSTPTSKPNQNSLIGTTLSGFSYWTTEWIFVDAMKTSSDWISLDQQGGYLTAFARQICALHGFALRCTALNRFVPIVKPKDSPVNVTRIIVLLTGYGGSGGWGNGMPIYLRPDGYPARCLSARHSMISSALVIRCWGGSSFMGRSLHYTRLVLSVAVAFIARVLMHMQQVLLRH